jgi:hypothetical protein
MNHPQKKADQQVVKVGKDSASRSVSISVAPTVTSSGQVYWSARDVLFNPERTEAAKTFERSLKK